MQFRNFILSAALCLGGHAFAQSALPPTSGLPSLELTGTASPATTYVCDAAHYGVKYTQTTTAGVSTSFICNPVIGTPTWVQVGDTYGFVNGMAVPSIGGLAAVDLNGHIIPPTTAQISLTVNTKTCTLGGTCNFPTGVQGENVVPFSATPAFVATAALNTITLTGNVTGWTLAAGTYGGQPVCLLWIQDATGTRAVPATATPSNVAYAFVPGILASKRSEQCFTWSSSLSLWTPQSGGIINF